MSEAATTCGVCGKDRDSCPDCGMCLLCADESVKEGEGYCPTCGERLLKWSNTWRGKWHDVSTQQGEIMQSLSKEIGRLREDVQRLTKQRDHYWHLAKDLSLEEGGPEAYPH